MALSNDNHAPQRSRPHPAHSMADGPRLTGTGGPDEITYAAGVRSRPGRLLVKGLENLTGRPRLIRMALDYQRDMAEGLTFWEAMRRRFRVSLDIRGAGVDAIPKEGPLVVVSNHPFGILDGLVLGCILSEVRGEQFKILANAVFVKAPEIEPHILPIDFGETRAAIARNLATRKEAIGFLRDGGAIGVFPGGAVSTGARFYDRRAYDPEWKTFTAKLVQQSGAAVTPLFFDGQNSRIFQVASHISDTLRLALLISEFDNRVGEAVRVMIGAPIDPETIARFRGDPKALMRFLRTYTYGLSPTPTPDPPIGKQW